MGLRNDGESVVIKIGYRNYNEKTWNCYCDFCNKKAIKGGTYAGDSASEARKEGWVTISCGLTAPMKWSCPTCHEKRLESGKASYKAIPYGVVSEKNGKAPPVMQR